MLMDRISTAVHDKISAQTALGRYVVYSEDELFEAFPEDADRDETELKKALKDLLAAGYVDVKYSGGSLYCIAPLKRYVAEPDPPPPPPLPEPETKPAKRIPAGFWAAFCGGALGSLIISLIFALVC